MFTAMFTVETFTKMSFIRRHFLGCFGDEQAFSLEKYKLSPFREIKKLQFIHSHWDWIGRMCFKCNSYSQRAINGTEMYWCVANRSLENWIFLVCPVIALFCVCMYVCVSSITLWHRLSYRAENLNITSLLGYLGRFLSVFRNFAFFGL